MSEQIKATLNYKTELEKNGVIAFVPSGNSMWPTLKNRAQSVIVARKTGRLDRLDVALYERADGSFVLHRVMEVNLEGYMMCGDSQFNLEPVKEERVLGKMLGFYQKDKYIEVTDAKYIKRVEKWFRRKAYRKIRLKVFYYSLAVKNKLKSFCKKG